MGCKAEFRGNDYKNGFGVVFFPASDQLVFVHHLEGPYISFVGRTAAQFALCNGTALTRRSRHYISDAASRDDFTEMHAIGAGQCCCKP